MKTIEEIRKSTYLEIGGFCLFWPHNGDRPAEVDIDDFCSHGAKKDLEEQTV